jgi:LmbE family N-acetylglucosaminyl deacetylase
MSLMARFRIGRHRRPVTPLDPDQLAGPLLVVAPHPDDESLGAAGLIALMQRAGQDIRVVVVSDGGASHPNSRRFSRAGLAEQRAGEARRALELLGVEPARLDLWNVADGAVPAEGHPDFDRPVTRAAVMLAEIWPRTLVLPWRADPHADHIATSAIWRAALGRWGGPSRLLEYPVWLDLVPDLAERPSIDRFRVLQLDIWPVLSAKRRAIEAHRSQTGLLIDDDPHGFRFDRAFRDRFETGHETFFEWII